MKNNKSGFSLIEVLFSISMVSVLFLSVNSVMLYSANINKKFTKKAEFNSEASSLTGQFLKVILGKNINSFSKKNNIYYRSSGRPAIFNRGGSENSIEIKSGGEKYNILNSGNTLYAESFESGGKASQASIFMSRCIPKSALGRVGLSEKGFTLNPKQEAAFNFKKIVKNINYIPVLGDIHNTKSIKCCDPNFKNCTSGVNNSLYRVYKTSVVDGEVSSVREFPNPQDADYYVGVFFINTFNNFSDPSLYTSYLYTVKDLCGFNSNFSEACLKSRRNMKGEEAQKLFRKNSNFLRVQRRQWSGVLYGSALSSQVVDIGY